MLVTGNMVGSGLFLLPTTLAGLGGISVLTWLLAAIGALVIAAVFARLGVLAPWAGGPYAFARVTMGRYFGFQTNYIYWISCWIGNVAVALAVTGYLQELLPSLKTPLSTAVMTSLVIWLLVLVNIVGPRLVGRVEAATILIGLAPIAVITAVGWFYFDPKIFMESWNVSGRPAVEAVPASLVLVFWAFTGLESAAVAAAVVDNPKRNLPIAVLAGVIIAALVYALSCTVLMGIIPARELAASTAPFALASNRLLGPGVATLIAFTTIAKASGTEGGWTLVTAATAKAAAEDDAFPRFFARTDRRGIPVQSLLFHGVLMTAAAFATISPTIGEQFDKLIDVSVVFSMICYAYSAYALYRLRPEGSHRARFDRIIAVLAIGFSVWVIVASDPMLLLISAIILATSIPLFPFYKGVAAPVPVLSEAE